MAEGTKQDVHFWKETVLFYLIMFILPYLNYSVKHYNFSKPCEKLFCFMTCKEKYNLCMYRVLLDRESLDSVS